ncbi:MAG: polysaccharide deacetylase, partial [Lachnospiraceae bacterium]|nr:polysaccharide deacetylase [Lachnospiraceae bacterium]
DENILKIGGKPFMRWSLDTLDWKTRDAAANYDNVIKSVKDGDVILMHDIHESTYQSINKILHKLKEMGYEICTVSELAEIRGVKLESGKVYYHFRP